MTDQIVARIAAFLKDRDESVLPDEVDDAERRASAEDILRLSASPEPSVEAVLPDEMTLAVKDVLSLMVWDSYRLARAYRAGGFDIPAKAEDEQAFVLWRLLRFAIEHGDNWRKAVQDDLARIRASLATDAEGRADG